MELTYVKCGDVKNGAKSLQFTGEPAKKTTSLGIANLVTSRYYFRMDALDVVPDMFIEGAKFSFSDDEFNFPAIDETSSMIWVK